MKINFLKIVVFCFLFFIFINNGFAEQCNFWICKVDTNSNLVWSNEMDIKEAIAQFVLYFLTFLSFIWVAFVMKWWFHILTAKSDEDKIKLWKKTIIFAMLWIFIVVIAYHIVNMVLIDLGTIKK